MFFERKKHSCLWDSFAGDLYRFVFIAIGTSLGECKSGTITMVKGKNKTLKTVLSEPGILLI